MSHATRIGPICLAVAACVAAAYGPLKSACAGPGAGEAPALPTTQADNGRSQSGNAGYIPVPDGRLYYETAGAGPVVVLIHDELLHNAVWDAQIPALAQGYRVVRYDRRGFGRSDVPAAVYSDLNDLLALFEHLRLERATLIGSSSGGELALDFTLAHPERVDALVLVGAVYDGLGYSTHFMRRNIANSGGDAAATIERWVNDRYEIAPQNAEARARARELLLANPQNLGGPRDRLLLQPERSTESLFGIAVPTLILVGEADAPDVHAHAGALAARIRGASRVVIPDAGHLVALEQPETLNREVLDFLSLLERRLMAAPPTATRPAGSVVTSGFAPVAGTALYYEAQGDGPALVLIHGGLLDHRMWDDQFDALARKYRVIRYDVRGYGLSPGPPGFYRDHEDLRALLNHLGIAKAHILGLSMGGRIAIDFALAYPELTRSLIAVGPGLSGYTFTDPEVTENLAASREAYLRGDTGRMLEIYQRLWTAGVGRELSQVDAAVRDRIQTIGRRSAEPWRSQARFRPLDPPAVGRLPEIRVPTLAITGTFDQPEILAICERLRAEVPGAAKVLIPGAAHTANMEQPAEFNRVVLKFLAEH